MSILFTERLAFSNYFQNFIVMIKKILFLLKRFSNAYYEQLA